MSPLVSVVVPTKGRVTSVQRAIDSITSQTLDDLEVLMIDDSSPDDHAILQKIGKKDDRIRVIRGFGRGPEHARWLGSTMARGTYLASLDSDDEWLPEKLRTHLTARSMHEERIGLSWDPFVVVDQNKLYISRAPPSIPRDGSVVPPEVLLRWVLLKPFLHMSAAVMEMQCFQQVGGFSMKRPSDYFLFVRLIEKKNALYVNEPLTVVHTEGSGRLSTNKEIMNDWKKIVPSQVPVIIRNLHTLGGLSFLGRWVKFRIGEIAQSRFFHNVSHYEPYTE